MEKELVPIHYFSRWTRIIPRYAKIMHILERTIKVENEGVGIIPTTSDIWVRDFMPFTRKDGRFAFYRYSPDYLQGNKEKYITDSREAFKSLFGGVKDLSEFFIETNLTIDGGNLISCVDKDGKDCIIMTDKVFKENSKWSKEEVLYELKRTFGADIIFIPWDTEEEYGHADGMVRALENGKLLVNCYGDMDEPLNARIIGALSDRFNLCQLSYGKHCSALSWCHLNYLELKNLIIVPTVGVRSDELALKQIADFTGKRCIPLAMREIVREGGGLHCISWSLSGNCQRVIDVLSDLERDKYNMPYPPKKFR